jgi:hypothetical protein
VDEIKELWLYDEMSIFRNKFETFEQAWNACERGDWMLRIAKELKVDFKKLMLTKRVYAQTFAHLMKDEKNMRLVEVAIKLHEGCATEKEFNDAYFAVEPFSVAAYIADAIGYDGVAYDDRIDAAISKQTADICRSVLTPYVFEQFKRRQ